MLILLNLTADSVPAAINHPDPLLKAAAEDVNFINLPLFADLLTNLCFYVCVSTGETAASGQTLPAVSTEPQQQISQ